MSTLKIFDSHESHQPKDTPWIGEAPVALENVLTIPEQAFHKLEHLKYIQRLDALEEDYEQDYDHLMWSVLKVLHHSKRTTNPDDVHIKVKVLWRNGERTWERYNTIRIAELLLLIEYAVEKKLVRHPDWSWTAEYAKTNGQASELRNVFKAAREENKFKFGVEVPTSVKHALEIDRTNANTCWRDAIDTELRQINQYETFIAPHGNIVPEGYQRIPYHIIFDVKFDLRRKARLVAGGHRTIKTSEDIYSGVVGMETIRTGFFIATLNDLKCCAANIGNAFLYGITREKVYIVAGPEFGEAEGKPLLIDKGLYGLRTSSARFHEHLSAKLRRMGYRPSFADNDMWMKDCVTHYSYIARFVDDLLVWDKDPMSIIETIREDYILKGVGAPEYYLGANVDVLDDSWPPSVNTALSGRTYIKNVTEKLEQLLECQFKSFKKPMDDHYHPELDKTPLLSPRMASIYRGIIGSGNWLITLGRFDINYAVSSLSRFSMAPREGHFQAAKQVMGYLKKYSKGKIVIDPNYRDWSKYDSPHDNDWKEFYPDAAEDIPTNAPVPRGKKVRITCYVDADHAHDLMTRRSVTGVLVYLNNTPVSWLSKRQKTVETSTYGSELVAARIATEKIIAMRYNLRMLGIDIDGPALMLGDNKSVVLSTTMPSSMLNKKHNAIAYHRVREAIAAQILRFVHVPSQENDSDCLTKPLNATKHYGIVKPILFRSPFHMGEDEDVEVESDGNG